jgi:small GTP-binding protein
MNNKQINPSSHRGSMIDSDVKISVKVVIIGEPGVGKTSIYNRFLFNKFDTNSIPTTGASYCQKVINIDKYNLKINFDIWDTAGQEKFRSLNKIFYKDADVALFIYDITRESSYKEIKTFWINELSTYSNEDIIKVLVGNKSDLYFDEKISEEEARTMADEKKCMFRYTSALNSSGIDELFEAIGEKFLETNDESNEKSFKINRNDKKIQKAGCCN